MSKPSVKKDGPTTHRSRPVVHSTKEHIFIGMVPIARAVRTGRDLRPAKVADRLMNAAAAKRERRRLKRVWTV